MEIAAKAAGVELPAVANHPLTIATPTPTAIHSAQHSTAAVLLAYPRLPPAGMTTPALSPLTLAVLGMESSQRAREAATTTPANATPTASSRVSRRATSHHNPFQTVCVPAQDGPPSYAIATRHGLAKRHPSEGHECLPRYTATVHAEARWLLQLESINPLHAASDSEWREVYVVVRGTLLCMYKLKDGGKGKLLRSYTLQHAEVGLATDTAHTVLLPKGRLGHLVPVAARRRAWARDPDLFTPVRQHLLRLRIETDQILLADASEDKVHDMVNTLSAGIDIAPVLEERSVPRQCTVPRRRRRQRLPVNSDLNDPALLAEQERILRDMYPGFAGQQLPDAEPRPELHRTITDDVPNEPLPTPTREEDDLDLAIMREDFATPNAPASSQQPMTATRPNVSRTTTATSVLSTSSTAMLYETSPTNFTADGKWQPPHPRTAAQIQRYNRRCMPVLLAESVRASDVLICHGRRVKINWRMQLLEEWELSPPSYKSHGFKSPDAEDGGELARSNSHVSATSPQSSRSLLGSDEDRIETIETNLANLELSKSVSGVEQKMPAKTTPVEVKRQEQRAGSELHGVVYCF